MPPGNWWIDVEDIAVEVGKPLLNSLIFKDPAVHEPLLSFFYTLHRHLGEAV
jgi:hypothetical protein